MTNVTVTTTATTRLVQGRHTLRRRSIGITLALAALATVLFTTALSVGDFPLPPGDVLRSLFGGSSPGTDFIVLELRLPRAAAALMVGAAFGIAGILFQSVLGNPLASPDIIGISAGASAAAVSAIIVVGWSGVLVAGSAFVGASIAAILIAALAWRGGLASNRLVLVGIAIAGMMNAVVSYVLTLGSITEAQQALVWLVGSFNGANVEEQVLPLGLALLILVPLVLALAPSLRNLQLGDATARGLGTRVEISRAALLVAAVVLAAFATAASGPLVFVAFMAGPIARRLIGPASLGVVAAALVGASITLGADLVAQHALPVQLAAGVVTGAIGAPYLLWLLATSGRESSRRFSKGSIS